MKEQNRIFLLAAIMAAICFSATAFSMWLLYNAAFEEERERLTETATSQARLIEAIERFDKKYSTGYPGGALAATLSQVRNAHKNYKVFGKTGEFTLARKEGDKIIYLLRQRHSNLVNLSPISLDSKLAIPMKLALSGESGTVVGPDYRGRKVLAAYEPLTAMNLGIVAKIDMDEIKAPFIRAALISVGTIIALILLGAALFHKISNPILRHLEDHNKALLKEVKERKSSEEALHRNQTFLGTLLDTISIPVFYKDNKGRYLGFNKAFEKFSAHSSDQLVGKTVFDINPPEFAENHHKKDQDLLEDGGTQEYDAQVKNTDGDLRDVIFNKAAFVDSQGVVAGLIGTITDITERKQAEIEQSNREQLLNEMGEIAKIGGWEHDLITRTATWTKETYKIVEIDDSDPIPGPDEHLDYYPAENRRILEEAYRRAMETEEQFDLELRCTTAKEQLIWVRAIGRPEFEGGKCVKMKGTFQDITEKKQIEEELRKSESLLQRVFEILPVGLWFADKNGKLIKGNPAGVRIWGAEPHVAMEEYGLFKAHRMPSGEEVAPDDWALEKTIKEGITIEDELLEIEAFDGKKKIILNYTAPILDKNGDVEAAVVVNLDISERVRAEEAARQSETNLRTLIDSIPDLVWLKDQNGVYLNCNPMFERFFGAKESEIVGKTDYDFVDRDLADFFRAKDRKAMEVGRPSINEEELTFADGGYHGLFETIKTPMRDADGTLIGVLGTARDISERTKAEKERLDLERKLKQAQKLESVGTLAGGIAHDFNNILSSVIGYSQLAQGHIEPGSKLEDFLQEIFSAGMRAKDLVNQILAFARQSDDEVAPIQASSIVKEVLKFLRSSIPTTIEIKHHIASESLIMGNAIQVHQILMNLCTNAYQAMEDTGGILNVKLKDLKIDRASANTEMALKSGDYLQLRVSDTGTGISPRIIDSIFEPYFTTKAIGEGTGLGLATVHGIVESYGGNISVESQPGEGTTFTIFFPITKKLGVHTIDTPIALPTGTERILFVDDEAPIATISELVLSELGYSVKTRTSSVEALELFKSRHSDFDLVITDMTMPNMTGEELARELLNIRPDIPIILCTGYSKKISAESASEIGIKELAYKPLAKADLAKTVRKVLDEANSSTKG